MDCKRAMQRTASRGLVATRRACASSRGKKRDVNIFVIGAHGFIGSQLCLRLAQRHHTVIRGIHRSRGAERPAPWARDIMVDFVHDREAGTWLTRLDNVDAVVNTVGLIREHGSATFARVHVETPIALFEACATQGVDRVVQFSALGADDGASSAYHRTKRQADEALLRRIPSAWSVQPSLVFGSGGASARLFCMLASLPWVPVPGRGAQRIQPIHVDDVVDAVCALLESDRPGGRIPLVGPAPLHFGEWVLELRCALGLPAALVVHVPASLMRAAAVVGERLPGVLLDRATLGMLERGNVADPAQTAELLGTAARPVAAFIAPSEADAWRRSAQLDWLLPVLRGSVALVWIVTGIVSLGLYPVADSYDLLARTGVPPSLAPLMLYGAASLDIAFGLLVLVLRDGARRLLWRAQAALILLYSLVIAWKLPEFWLHPYGPMLKNVPLLAVLVALDAMETRK